VVEASRRIQEKSEKSSKQEHTLFESPSKIARFKEVASDNQKNKQNGDDRIRRNSRERENRREFTPKDSNKDGRNRNLNRDSRDNDNRPAYNSDRSTDRNNKHLDSHPRDYERNRFSKEYQGRERENDRERREYRGRSADRQKDSYISRQNPSRRSVKDVITGAMLENIKKEKIQEKFRSDDSRRYDHKEPQTKRDVYYPPEPKEDNKMRDDSFRLRKDRDFNDRNDRESERSSRRDSPQRDRSIDQGFKRAKSLERSWGNDKRREFDSRQNNYMGRRDVYAPPLDTKSRNNDEYRDKRNRVSSFEKSDNVSIKILTLRKDLTLDLKGKVHIWTTNLSRNVD
jgi:hypothetical protein